MGKNERIYLPEYMLFIYYLNLHQPCTVTKLARKMKMPPSTCYYIRRRMLDYKLIYEIRPDDRRHMPFMLTEKGIALCNHISGIIKVLDFGHNVMHYRLKWKRAVGDTDESKRNV